MWPLPPIHKSSAGHGWRAGRSGTRRSGGRVLRKRGGTRKTSAPAGASLWSCVRGSTAAGSCAALGAALRGPCRGGGASDGASCAAPSLGAGQLPGAGLWALRRSLPGGGRAAKDTCRLPGLRQAGASAQRPGAWLLRSGGAESHAIHASTHLREGRWPWPAAGGGREVAYGRGLPPRRWAAAPGALRLPPALVADAALCWRLFLPAPPRPGAPSAERSGRGVAWGRPGSLQGPGGRALPSSAESSGAKLSQARNPLAACTPCAPPPPSPPAPFGPAPRLPRAQSSSHCSPAAT